MPSERRLNKTVTAVLAVFFALALTVGAFGSFISGLDIPIENPVRLAFIWVLAAAISAAAFSWKRGGWLILGLLALGGGYLWRQGELWEQTLRLIGRVSRIYDQAYHWGYLDLSAGAWNTGTGDLPLAVAGVLLTLAVTWTVCRGESSLFAIGYSLAPLVLCLVVTDTVPGVPWLYLLLLGDVLLLLTGRVRQENGWQGSRLTLLAALPVALALGVLFLAMPQEGYVDRSAQLRQWVLGWFENEPQTTQLTLPGPLAGPRREPEAVDLAALDRWNPSDAPVMTVTAETGGPLYLRGQDYDGYDGRSWAASPRRVERLRFDGVDLGVVTVETRQNLSQLYLPYYPLGGLSLVGGRIENTRLSTVYSFPRSGLPEDWAYRSAPPEDGDSSYLDLPEAARAGAEGYLAALDLTGTTAQRARAIADFVRDSARYDQGTGKMPEGQADFALWFLEESDRGYCVHFATAATVLLRAAGIPARYVSGYLIPAGSGEAVTVTGNNAHAWAEYFDPGLNAWLILEATPAQGLVPPAEETAPAATQAATVPATAPETTAPAAPPAQTEPAPTGAAAPAAPQEPEKPSVFAVLLPILGRLAGAALLLALIEGQRRLRLKLRRLRGRRGGPNARALARWQEVELVSRLLREAPPDALEALANKAKFSQHTLTAEELSAFESCLRSARRALEERPWYWRLLYRYFYAVI